MLIETIHSQLGWAGLLGVFFIYSTILYLIGTNLSYYWYFKRKRQRLMPDYVPNPREKKQAIRLSLISIAGNCLLVLPLELAIAHGYSQLYASAATTNWAMALMSVLGALLFAETAIYWIHRGLHAPWPYRHLHRYHHRFRMPTPFVSYAFHPLDNFLQALPYHVYVFIVPMPEFAYLALLGAATVWTILIHDRVVWVRPGLINNSGCHTVHHWFFRYNYGNYFAIWDRLMGTYVDPVNLPEQFFAAKYTAATQPNNERDSIAADASVNR